MEDLACAAASLEAGESLVGTAIESVDRWLLLEVNDTWAPKPLQTEALAGVRRRLAEWLDTPRTRLQLIRRPGRSGRTLRFMRVTPEGASGVDLDRYEDLTDLDLEAMPALDSGTLCLVCVHGRRDRCCARHGSAVYRALHGSDFDLWQTSHLGGHRFAACVLTLPDGLMYGRLRPEHADGFAIAGERGELFDLDLFRGRCAYDRPTQAAEIFLRQRGPVTSSEPIEWIDTIADGDGHWTARFRTPEGEQSIRVRQQQTGQSRPASCGGEPEAVERFVEARVSELRTEN